MSLKVPQSNSLPIFKDGYKHLQGLDEAILRNIQAVIELSDLVRTSFGPNGRNKLIINHLGKLFVTSDAATIIREIEVVHPAAKLLVMASQAQEAEMGDSTNLVIILGGELLKKAENLLIMGLKPTDIIPGYELACAKALAELESLSTFSVPTPITPSALAAALKPALASKQYGLEDPLAALIAEAALTVMPTNPRNFNVDNVRVVKIMGGSLSASRVVQGMVFGREPEGTVKQAKKAKVAVFTSALDMAQTETKGTVLIKNAEEMLNFTTGEEKHLDMIISQIAASGVSVIIGGSSMSDLTMHYLNRHNIAVLKVLSKFELRRVCRVVNATPLARMGPPTPEEMGYVDVFETIEIGGDRVTVLRQLVDGDEGFDPQSKGDRTRTATIVLRGATANQLDDLERAVDDGVNVLKGLLKDGRMVPGAGAVEIELAKRVENYGAGLKGLPQHGVRRFANALECVPRILAENALGGAVGNEVVSRLWAKHETAGGETWGVDVENETDGTLDAAAHKIYDSLASKSWAIKLATEAAVSVLSVDAIIMSKPAGGPKIPQQSGNWDNDD
ncbi:chaperonin Cpn60/TCP-1 family [Roridomyces roridus]|uniref:CCT-theta n=1 Tax=Roridomyces roridus TaxID=1738132 RepID=A0AAD7CFV3_9AGAR|nr:chaperonin Cpn60/TCP-1 family [Roridomyces roridus]